MKCNLCNIQISLIIRSSYHCRPLNRMWTSEVTNSTPVIDNSKWTFFYVNNYLTTRWHFEWQKIHFKLFEFYSSYSMLMTNFYKNDFWMLCQWLNGLVSEMDVMLDNINGFLYVSHSLCHSPSLALPLFLSIWIWLIGYE